MMNAAVLKQLMAGIQADRSAYAELESLLEAQFGAIVRCDAPRLALLAESILQLSAALDGRRCERERLLLEALGVSRLTSIEQVFMRLPADIATRCRAHWEALCSKVQHCQSLNTRNGRLMSEQHGLLTRVMFGDEDVYVSA
ncbi:flagellar protein FlgN [Rhodobacteraceae bacterium CH30]|nr:flagellar protein FlgN [Rhodobacteraceae bacterium CH30]